MLYFNVGDNPSPKYTRKSISQINIRAFQTNSKIFFVVIFKAMILLFFYMGTLSAAQLRALASIRMHFFLSNLNAFIKLRVQRNYCALRQLK